MTSQILDDTEYGVGHRYDLSVYHDGDVVTMRAVPDHLVGFARAELRDRYGVVRIHTATHKRKS